MAKPITYCSRTGIEHRLYDDTWELVHLGVTDRAVDAYEMWPKQDTIWDDVNEQMRFQTGKSWNWAKEGPSVDSTYMDEETIFSEAEIKAQMDRILTEKFAQSFTHDFFKHYGPGGKG